MGKRSSRKPKHTAGSSQWADAITPNRLATASPLGDSIDPGDMMQAGKDHAIDPAVNVVQRRVDPSVVQDRDQDRVVETEHVLPTQSKQHAHSGTGPRYPEDVKRAVVTAMIELNPDHSLSNASIDAARSMLGKDVNVRTLNDWLHTYGDEIRAALPQAMTTQQIVSETTSTVLQDFVTIRQKLIDHLKSNDTIDKMAGQHAALAMGIVHDKIQKLTALSPEDTQLMLRYIQVCNRYHVDYKQQMVDFCEHIEDYYKNKSYGPSLMTGNPG